METYISVMEQENRFFTETVPTYTAIRLDCIKRHNVLLQEGGTCIIYISCG